MIWCYVGFVSSNPVNGEVYSIQDYVIKFVSDLRQVGAFRRVLRFSSTNKNDCHDITERLSMLVVIGTDCIGSYKSNYYAITTTTAPSNQ
jgi:tryptophan synthase alpha subunit